MNYSIHDIIAITGADLLSGNAIGMVAELVIDSRKIVNPEGSLFLSINKDAKRAGNLFLEDAYQKGIRMFLTDRKPESSLQITLPDARILLVDDTIVALQKIAVAHRDRFQIPVIGIAGSNGKTIIKEWLYQLLHEKFNIVRSPKSYNSQIGVPLSVWQLDPLHDLAIFEAGISQKGEMQKLEKIIRPEIGILGYMGDAHANGFASLSEKTFEKLSLFLHSKTLIYCADQPVTQAAVNRFKHEVNSSLYTVSWGEHKDALINIVEKSVGPQQTSLQLIFAKANYHFIIPFTDQASIFNAMCCISLLLYLGWTEDQIQVKLSELHPVGMRLELKQGIHNTLLINDSYSADLASLQIALGFMQQQQLHKKRTVILSDFLQTGQSSDELYAQLSDMLMRFAPSRLIGIGPEISQQKRLFDGLPEKQFYTSISEFISEFPSLKFDNETILIKGARLFEFERIAVLLEKKIHETVLEIDLSAIRQNLKFYRNHLKPGVRMMVMVKAFSYGSGAHEIAHLLQDEGVEYLAVAYTDEGADLRKAGVRLPIMVMNPAVDDFETMIHHQLEPEIYSFHILKAFIDFLNKLAIGNFPIHIKLDTGMHRLGFEAHEIQELGTILQIHKQLHVRSVFSHLVASEDPGQDAYTHEQYELFGRLTADLEQQLNYPFLKHICNSSGIIRHPDFQLDMVRLGIGLYVAPEGGKPVAVLKTTIAQIKRLKKGQTVGYGRAGMIEKDSVIATVRIGYADGYPRCLSNGKGGMLVNGTWAPVIGNVCMDMTMIDITGIEAKEGDSVIVFGEKPSILEIARLANTITYEILTGISQRVKRVYFQE